MIIKKNFTAVAVFAALLVVSAGISRAAVISLNNGGLGQIATDPQQFSVAICNVGGQTAAAGIPVSLSVGDTSTTIQTASPIIAGDCEHDYVNYADLGMRSGQEYSVVVTIDQYHTVIANVDNRTSYNVIVPDQQVASLNNGTNLLADAAAQLTKPFVLIWNWIAGLLGKL